MSNVFNVLFQGLLGGITSVGQGLSDGWRVLFTWLA